MSNRSIAIYYSRGGESAKLVDKKDCTEEEEIIALTTGTVQEKFPFLMDNFIPVHDPDRILKQYKNPENIRHQYILQPDGSVLFTERFDIHFSNGEPCAISTICLFEKNDRGEINVITEHNRYLVNDPEEPLPQIPNSRSIYCDNNIEDLQESARAEIQQHIREGGKTLREREERETLREKKREEKQRKEEETRRSQYLNSEKEHFEKQMMEAEKNRAGEEAENKNDEKDKHSQPPNDQTKISNFSSAFKDFVEVGNRPEPNSLYHSDPRNTKIDFSRADNIYINQTNSNEEITDDDWISQNPDAVDINAYMAEIFSKSNIDSDILKYITNYGHQNGFAEITRSIYLNSPEFSTKQIQLATDYGLDISIDVHRKDYFVQPDGSVIYVEQVNFSFENSEAFNQLDLFARSFTISHLKKNPNGEVVVELLKHQRFVLEDKIKKNLLGKNDIDQEFFGIAEPNREVCRNKKELNSTFRSNMSKCLSSISLDLFNGNNANQSGVTSESSYQVIADSQSTSTTSTTSTSASSYQLVGGEISPPPLTSPIQSKKSNSEKPEENPSFWHRILAATTAGAIFGTISFGIAAGVGLSPFAIPAGMAAGAVIGGAAGAVGGLIGELGSLVVDFFKNKAKPKSEEKKTQPEDTKKNDHDPDNAPTPSNSPNLRRKGGKKLKVIVPQLPQEQNKPSGTHALTNVTLAATKDLPAVKKLILNKEITLNLDKTGVGLTDADALRREEKQKKMLAEREEKQKKMLAEADAAGARQAAERTERETREKFTTTPETEKRRKAEKEQEEAEKERTRIERARADNNNDFVEILAGLSGVKTPPASPPSNPKVSPLLAALGLHSQSSEESRCSENSENSKDSKKPQNEGHGGP